MKLKNKVISLVLSSVICLTGVMSAYAEAPVSSTDGASADKQTKPAITKKSDEKQKSEASHVLSKFLVSMLWVAGSCVAIFLLLLAYKRFKTGAVKKIVAVDISKNLNSPDTVEEATKLFIEKF